MAEENRNLPQPDNKKPKIANATVKKNSIGSEIINYVVKEEIEPRSKELMRNIITGTFNMINDALNKGVDRWIYPDGGAPHRVTRNGNSIVGNYVPRTNYSTTVVSNNGEKQRDSINQRSSINVNYIWVDTEDEAKNIVANLVEDIENYGKAKVASLYEMVGAQTNFSDFKFGWTKDDVNRIGYYRDRGKFFIDLPKPTNIENV